ncbi:MAG TPA: indolepyruvate ferredoxin oxidoreductase subunit alpha [Bacillota bacterium]|nr:indolepyruvate ferredoxin oxidoreductase subunit alpha [Bacillota bacterium]
MELMKLLTGNEAIARGAYESGVVVAAAYPGTPSTEILEEIAKYDEIYAEWSPNEKVALEVAIGASIAGVRSIVAMKHVGLNVAADPLFTVAYTGVTGGLVIVSADDPGMHSSQNEQDNRNYAKHAKMPMLEPSDSQEAKDFVGLALSISEEYDTPVLLRITTRIAHSKSLVTLGTREPTQAIPYTRRIPKYVATPANSRILRVGLEHRLRRLTELSNTIEVNKIEFPEGESEAEIGVVAAGVAYQYAREAFGDNAIYLKLGMTYPMPLELVRQVAERVKTLYVVEELDPFMQDQIQGAGINCVGKQVFPSIGEFTPEVVSQAVSINAAGSASASGTGSSSAPEEAGPDAAASPAIARPPSLCAGCPHRSVFYVLRKRKNIMVTGDIGCYTLGSAAPLSAMDTCICMGASISAGHGASKAFSLTGRDTRVVAVIGDSTFFHSGITGLLDVVYNRGSCVTIVLDNRTTGMTGHQDNPGTGYTVKGERTVEVDIGDICRALGIERVTEVNPYSLSEIESALDESLSLNEPSVIVVKHPCLLKKPSPTDARSAHMARTNVIEDKCRSCKLCLSIGCPALSIKEFASIDPEVCAGCGVCVQVCPFHAIERETVDEG